MTQRKQALWAFGVFTSLVTGYYGLCVFEAVFSKEWFSRVVFYGLSLTALYLVLEGVKSFRYWWKNV